jgi:hypothetical protein
MFVESVRICAQDHVDGRSSTVVGWNGFAFAGLTVAVFANGVFTSEMSARHWLFRHCVWKIAGRGIPFFSLSDDTLGGRAFRGSELPAPAF